MNVLSLFSGIGGLELGLERAGMTVVGQVEIDPFCRSVLAKHWPGVPKHDDVRTAVEWWRGESRPPVHVVAGGFPCQPFSGSGRRRGVADERWAWPSMADVVRAVRPRYILVENVADLVRDSNAFGWLLGDLSVLGFDADWSVVSACSLGAPHLRDRVFLVAHTEGERWGPRRVQPGSHGPASGRRPTQLGPERRTWWSSEPDVGRVAYGVPGRVDRVRALGNAVVPQVAEHIGRLILAAEEVAA